MKIKILDNSTRGVDDSAAVLSSYIDTVVRVYAPFYVRSWRDVPNEIKEHIRSRVLVSLLFSTFFSLRLIYYIFYLNPLLG